jgi:hypothetical protein
MSQNRKNTLDAFLKSRYILYRKKAIFRKISMRLKESEIIEQLEREIDRYAPLTIKSIEREVQLEGFLADALIEFCIADGPCFKAMVEVKTVATPKIISQAAQQLTAYLRRIDDKTIVPVVIVPYMGTEQAQTLQQEGISWIDLSGNMVIRVGNRVYIERTGKKNLFPDTSPIKKIFEGTSSLVSRALLLKKEPFRSLNEIYGFINQRSGNITLSTVSKVLSSLEEGLLITKTEAGISVTNREKLLDKLVDGYRTYTERNENKTYTFAFEDTLNLFMVFFQQPVEYVSCGFYAAMLKGLATTDRITIFVKSVNEAKRAFENSYPKIKPDAEFGQLDLVETRNTCVWFNVAKDKPLNCIVDDIELYLEMMIDTPRGPKVAEMLKERILKGQE